MRLILLTALTMTAFAANSILNRLAVDSGAISPEAFAAIRMGAGATMLAALVTIRGGRLLLFTPRRLSGALALSVYMVGFSLAYRELDAGLGALILFGVVQMSMFGWAAYAGIPATRRQLAGAGLAFAGLIWVLWPGAGASADPANAALMVAAGIGWAAYTLLGRAEPDALAATAGNFCVALVPVGLWAVLWAPGWGQPGGIALAVLSGAVTSGLGYALWYALLPRLDTGLAATVQVSVPVIALAAGIVILGETATLGLVLGAALVLGGIVLAIRR